MPGLLDEAMAGGGQQPAGPAARQVTPPQVPGAPQPEQAMEGEEPAVDVASIGNLEQSFANESEQRAYTQLVTDAAQFIYHEQILPKVMSILENAEEPADGISQVVNLVGQQIEQNALSAGEGITDEIRMAAGEEIIEIVVDLGEEAGLFDLSEDDLFKVSAKVIQDYMATSVDIDIEGMSNSLEQINNTVGQDAMRKLSEMQTAGNGPGGK